MENRAGNKKHIAGYSGHVPGDKWKFGSRSPREEAQEQVLDVQSAQMPTEDYRIQAENYRSRTPKPRPVEKVYSANVSTQFPVHSREMAIQADYGGPGEELRPIGMDERSRAVEEVEAGNSKMGRGQPYSRNGYQYQDSVFMREKRDPFAGTQPSEFTRSGITRRRENTTDQRPKYAPNNDFMPTPGYTGHIQGMQQADVGKRYTEIMKDLGHSKSN